MNLVEHIGRQQFCYDDEGDFARHLSERKAPVLLHAQTPYTQVIGG